MKAEYSLEDGIEVMQSEVKDSHDRNGAIDDANTIEATKETETATSKPLMIVAEDIEGEAFLNEKLTSADDLLQQAAKKSVSNFKYTDVTIEADTLQIDDLLNEPAVVAPVDELLQEADAPAAVSKELAYMTVKIDPERLR